MDKSGIENKQGAATPSSGTIDRGHGPHRRPPIPITTNNSEICFLFAYSTCTATVAYPNERNP
jgi:hypothetical protein